MKLRTIDFRAGAMEPPPVVDGRIAEFCVYTMRHSRDLHACLANGGTASLTERTKWVTGSVLFGRASASGERMPIVFSAAERDGGLTYWAVLADVIVEDGDAAQGIGPKTTYSLQT